MKLLALVPVAVVLGCGSAGRDHVARLDDHHTLSAAVTVGNLTVWPVRTDRPLDVGEFLTLDEALAKGVAEVREVGPVPFTSCLQEEGAQTLQVGPSGGSAVVNTLVIDNKSDLPILVCAGTVVKGGNQDRQIGQDFVIQARTATSVDAFCVEQGRWQPERLGADTGGKFQVLDGMATAKVRAKGQYEKDQRGVWQEVASAQITMSEPVASTSFAVAFDANATAAADDLKRCEEAVKSHFAKHGDAVGFAYAVNGKPVAVRAFAHPRLLRKHLDDFARGMATEALLAKTPEAAPAATATDVVALVKRISAAEEKVHATGALNRNGVRACEAGYNANCYLPGGDVAITRDWTAK
jgi:hypothetical protein